MKLSLIPWSEMSLRNRSMVIWCGALIFILGFFCLICQPKSVATEALYGKLQQQQKVLQNARRDVREMPDPAGYYRQLQEEETRVKALLPDNDALTDLLVALNTLGKEQKVRIISIKQGSFTDCKTYYEIPLDMTVTGAYPELLHFINKLENLRRFNSITKIGAREEENLLTMQLAMVVYVYGPMPRNLQAKSK